MQCINCANPVNAGAHICPYCHLCPYRLDPNLIDSDGAPVLSSVIIGAVLTPVFPVVGLAILGWGAFKAIQQKMRGEDIK